MVLLFFTGCEQKEDTEIFLLENKTHTDVKSIKQQFEAVNLSDAFLKEAFKVKWNQYEVIDNADGSLIYEFSTNLYAKLDLVNDELVKSKNTKKIFSVYKLLAKESPDGLLSFEILKFTGNNSKELKDISLSDLSDFNGAINYSTLEGTYVKDEIYDRGMLTNTFIQKPDPTLLAKAPPIGDADDGFVWVREVDVVDWYNVCLSCGGGATNPENRYYRSTTYTPVWVLIPRTTGALYGQLYHFHNDEPSYTGPHGGTRGVDTHLDEIIFDPSFVDTKAECIYNRLNQMSTNFKDAIKKFDGEFPVSHLSLKINNNLGPDIYGFCTPPDGTSATKDFQIMIEINESRLGNLSDLGKATVFIHEVIHAEIYRKMMSAAQLGHLNTSLMNALQVENYLNSLKDNFPGLYDYYRERYHPTWNHNMMASHYRSTIADMLQQFDNFRLPRSAYENLAWAGLGKIGKNQETIAWQNLTETEKTTITNLLNQHIFSGPSNCN